MKIIFFSHNFVKTWPVSKETGLFYVSITFCKPQKTHMIPITHKCLLQPICISPAKPCVQPFVALVPHIPLQKPLLTLMNILV